MQVQSLGGEDPLEKKMATHSSIVVWEIPYTEASKRNMSLLGFPHSSVGKESNCNAGDPGSIPGLGRSAGEGHGNSLEFSSLENPMDR